MAQEPAPHEARFGYNAWLVDEMYRDYLADPASVGEAWQEFFSDYRPDHPAVGDAAPRATSVAAASSAAASNGGSVAAPAPAPAAAAPAPAPAPAAPAAPTNGAAKEVPGDVLKPPASILAKNMQQSLQVPTATSFRDVPAKLLEVNRSVINGYLGRTRGGKVSFTHLIGYAVVRAAASHVPAMRSTYLEGPDGKPRLHRPEHVNLGLAVDVERPDGGRTLMVPVIKRADALDFKGFWAAYEDLIRKVRGGKLGADELSGATMTLTNPGTIGTVQSVPRLMQGQSVIVGAGRIDYPAEWSGADGRVMAELGMSKVVTVTSTYDHRVIQGAESGLFLKTVHELLVGEHGFYEDVFRSLGVPYESVRWHRDTAPLDRETTLLEKQMKVNALVNAHRVRGHLIADLDPLAWKEPQLHPELDPATYGLTIWDLDREFLTGGVAGEERMPLGDLLHLLRDAYCRTVGVEYMHIQEPDEKRWIQDHVEGVSPQVDPLDQRHILERLNAAEAFERFLATKYVGQKRFGLEGAESAIVVLDAVLASAADEGLDGAVLGMAHRGRLNVLTNIVGKNYDQIFREFEGHVDPDSVQGSGDVKYHLGASGTFRSRKGSDIQVDLAANPSHLEAVDPVVLGMARARQDLVDEPGTFSWLPVLVHGDAAFAGQGVVAECLNMSNISGYRVGGTIHLIINNQLGFTTAPHAARSSTYSTDVAKMVQAPIFHVNGDDPEACYRVALLAYAYRQAFHKDVVIDLVCYRRHGHNEGDDPSYTQPLMYRRIDERRSVRKLYTEALVKRGDITIDEAEQALQDYQARLQAAFDQTRQSSPPAFDAPPPPAPVGVLPHVETGVARDVLDEVFAQLDRVPDGFVIHPKLARQFETRAKAYREAGDIDWATGEALAIGSLLVEGTDVRLAGEDTRRGTFSQRHATLVCYESGDERTPLATLPGERTGKLWIYDSLLSEYAALGFEYGYSVVNAGALVVWEAQFGDFINVAQVIIDQFIVSAEDKWGQRSGLVLLLPHGYEGQGPEHSSARVERFLTLAAEDNIQVAYPTSAAQYFHLLRRQIRRDVRKPLVVITPKSLLRAKTSRSRVDELTHGSFQETLGDPGVTDPAAVRRIVLCSGKVAYDALAARDQAGAPIAVVRVEQLYPWPAAQVAEVLERYSGAEEVVWLQEEPENMGAWRFVESQLLRDLPAGRRLSHVSRAESGSPATGSSLIHAQEQAGLMRAVVGGL